MGFSIQSRSSAVLAAGLLTGLSANHGVFVLGVFRD